MVLKIFKCVGTRPMLRHNEIETEMVTTLNQIKFKFIDKNLKDVDIKSNIKVECFFRKYTGNS